MNKPVKIATRAAAVVVTSPIWLVGFVMVSPLLLIAILFTTVSAVFDYALTGEWKWDS